MTKSITTIALFLSIFLLSSCGGSEDTFDDEVAQLQAYAAANNITLQTTGSGLMYVIEEQGDAERPDEKTAVTVHYRGYFVDGVEFDSSYNGNDPPSFLLNAVIQGWTEGIQLFGRGGKGKLFIPSKLGYGSDGRSGIPGNEPLIFDVHLIDF